MIGSPKRSALISFFLHAAVIAIVAIATGVKNPAVPTMRVTPLVYRDVGRYLRTVPPGEHGGGGGGERDTTPATRGRLPKFAPHQFTPPVAVIRNFDPLLAVEPSLVGNAQIVVPSIDLPQYGDPAAPPGPPSGGRGTRGGIGDGDGGGVGNRRGPGYGDGGDDGGATGFAGLQGNLTAPLVLWKIEPEYTEEARRARIQGTVILRIEVDASGRARNITVRQSLGLGLDQRAVEAVTQWKFRPGYAGGRPVVTTALVEVNFRLL